MKRKIAAAVIHSHGAGGLMKDGGEASERSSGKWPGNKGKEGGDMRRPAGLFLAIILLITGIGCSWGWEQDRRGYGDRERGGYDNQEQPSHGEREERH